MRMLNHRNRNYFSGIHLLGTIFCFAGTVSLIGSQIMESPGSQERPIIIGISGLFIGLIILNSYSGVIIDFEKKRFKNYRKWSGISQGVWSELPKVSAIKVETITETGTNTPNGISPTLSGTVVISQITLTDFQGNKILTLENLKSAEAESLKASLDQHFSLS